jgi:hypothetical protein
MGRRKTKTTGKPPNARVLKRDERYHLDKVILVDKSADYNVSNSLWSKSTACKDGAQTRAIRENEGKRNKTLFT